MGKGEFWEVWELEVIMGDGNIGGLSGDLIVGKLSKLPHPELSFMRFLKSCWQMQNTKLLADVCSRLSHIWLFATLWTVAHQAPLSMAFSRQEYWSGLPSPPPEDLPYPQMEPASLMSPALAGGFFTTSTTWKDALVSHFNFYFWTFSFFFNFLGH